MEPSACYSTREEDYELEEQADRGSFGIVYKARYLATGHTVAIKKVFQDRRYKNRELELMKDLSHPNVIQFLAAFHTVGSRADEEYLNIVMEFVPDTLYKVVRLAAKARKPLPHLLVKLYSYQLLRGLAYLHSLGITHRDVKPQNYLVNPATHVVKLCDFGSAKRLVRGEASVAYISSRFYRAPELIFGSTQYTTAIDLWSAGCVIAELMLGKPLFAGDSGVDQLIEIMKVLGTPTADQLLAMNPNYTDFKFPILKATGLARAFREDADPAAIDSGNFSANCDNGLFKHPSPGHWHHFSLNY